MKACLAMIEKPVTDPARYDRVWNEVHALRDAYEMNP
jgi:hypothetical protein